MTLPACASATPCCGTITAGRPPLSIDISCPQSAQQQTRRPPLLLSIDGTDRRTPDRYLDPAPHTIQQGVGNGRAGSVNNAVFQ